MSYWLQAWGQSTRYFATLVLEYRFCSTRRYSVLVLLTLLTLNSWAHLHPHRWIPGRGGGWKNPEYFVMLYLYEDTNRILAYEQIITSEGVVLYWWMSCQGHIEVISRSKLQKNIENTHFLSISSCLVVQSFIRKDWWWHILGRVSFQHTFLGNLWQCWYWEK